MTGLEYILLHVQEPILFVIRKQNRHSSSQVTPLADYYIIAGYVYQAPDLNSLISFRLTSGIHHLVSAFDETQSYMRYHPTKGYSWEFGKDKDGDSKDKDSSTDKQKEEPSSAFQRARVDLLLGEICKKFFESGKTIENTAANQNKPADQPKQQNGEQQNAIQNGLDKTNNQLNSTANSSSQISNFNRTQPVDKKPRIN